MCLLALVSPLVSSVGAGTAENPATSADTEPSGVQTPEASSGPQLEFTAFHDLSFIQATRSGSPVALYFEADWCAPCQKMHASTFREPAVLEAASGFRLFRVDLTNADFQVNVIRKSFEVRGAPTIILFGPDGKERMRRFGFISADEFVRMLHKSGQPAKGT